MRILIAQEKRDTAANLAKSLLTMGFTTDIAPDGESALWRAREGDYAAIVLDLLLPKRNGYDICESLRYDGITTPILLLTAKSDVEAEIDGLESGADDFLRKPYSVDVLAARLRALQRRAHSDPNNDLVLGKICFNPTNFICSFNGRSIELTPREAQLLEVLLRAKGKIVTKKKLIHHIWGLEFDGDPNIVNVYVGYLRRKFGAVYNRPVLKTIRGIGYRLVDLEN